MMRLNTSLLRERFTIKNSKGSTDAKIAIGNRLSLPLVNDRGDLQERLIVRAHTMHLTLRLAAILVREFQMRGPIANRQVPLDFAQIWDDITHDFERAYNPDMWCAVYYQGRVLFQNGAYHPFLDVMEQCDIKNRAEYDRAITIAEDIFKQAGKDVKIYHDVNIGLVIGATDRQIRCGLIVRNPSHASTFNFIMDEDADIPTPLKPYHGLELSACYLEAVQLAVVTGMAEKTGEKTTLPIRLLHERIGRLAQSIQGLERIYKVRYRPERPHFRKILEEAKKA